MNIFQMSFQINFLATSKVTEITYKGLNSIVNNSFVFVQGPSLSEGRRTFITLIRSGSNMCVNVFSQCPLCLELLLTLRTREWPHIRVGLLVSLDLRLTVEECTTFFARIGLLSVFFNNVDIQIILGFKHFTTMFTGILFVPVEIFKVMIVTRGRLEDCTANLTRPNSGSMLFSFMFPQSAIINCNQTTDCALFGRFT